MNDQRRTLFDISEDLLALSDKMEELGGDVTSPEVEQAVDEWFEQLGRERDEKLDNYGALIRELEARAEARKEEARRLSKRARRDADQADYLKERLVHFFEQHGLKSIETRRYRLTLARASRAPVVLNVEPEQLPEAFQRHKVSADRRALREALEQGEQLEFAKLGERRHYMRIS